MKKFAKISSIFPIISIVFWICLLIYIYTHLLIQKSDGLYAGHPYVWSDWALHIGMARIFATKDPSIWFATHPLYAGGKFTYGFLTNLVSGLLMRIGLPISFAFNFPSVILAIFLVIGIYLVALISTKSKITAALSLYLFFFSSGLGFVKFVSDFIQNPSLDIISYPPIEYSKNDNYEWGSGNVLTGMLVPQRAFLMGLTFAIWSIISLFHGINHKLTKKNKILLIGGGFLAGLLPITHMHSFIALVILGITTLILHRKKWINILYFAIPAGLLASILYLKFISGGIENPNFMQWFPGWTAKGGLREWLWMWWQLWGILLPFIIYVSISQKRSLPNHLISIILAGLLIFCLANLILFQPIHWDNSKLFLWSYLFFSIIASYGLSKLDKQKIFLCLIFFLLTATGILEVIRLVRFEHNTYQMISTEKMLFTETIRKQTDPLAIFATSPTHNHPIVMWAARPIVLGYTAWAWNFGFLYQQREADLKTIFQAKSDVKPLISKYHISYLYIGENEVRDYSPNITYFSQNFPLVFRDTNTLVFDTRSEMFGK